jgi:hypothetical protein
MLAEIKADREQMLARMEAKMDANHKEIIANITQKRKPCQQEQNLDEEMLTRMQ